MAGRKMQDRKLEELSQEELQKKIEEDKKKVKSSLVLAFSAVIAIIALCIAWFVANNLVNGKSSTLAADSEVPFVLASTGERLYAEETYFLNENNQKQLTNGDSYTPENQTYYTYDYDSAGKRVWTKATADAKTTYYTGISNLAWRFSNSQESFGPGASGKLEFYIIPKNNMIKSCKVSLEMQAYSTSENTNRAIKCDDTNLQNLLSGHILLFQKLDDTNGYSGWLNPEDNTSFTVTAPEGGFQKGVPYKVTIYWVWAKYLRNYVYGARSTNGDLFTNITDANEDYTNVQFMVNARGKTGTNKINRMYASKDAEDNYSFANLPGDTDDEKLINKNMSDSVLDTWSTYYDDADEYIGTKANYVYINATVE